MTQATTSQQPFIKSKNRKWLIIYFLLNIVIFAIFTGYVNFSLMDADQFIAKIKNPQGVISLAAAVLIIVMEGIFKNGIKEVLIFWRFKNRLPGHHAFSHIGPNDPRINMKKIALLFPHGLPADPKEQNNEWYELYRLYRDEPQVFHSHEAFLLTRDLASLTIVFIPLATLGHFLFGNSPVMLAAHILILIGLFLVISLSARNYGERFTANVLVEAQSNQAKSN